jgi:hypothetical protein
VLDQNRIIGDLNIASTSRVELNGHKLTLQGVVSGTGVIRGGSGDSSSVVFDGASGTVFLDQTTPGTTNRLLNLTMQGTSPAITLGNALQVRGVLTPSSGTLTTGGYLTLVALSTSSYGQVEGLTAGIISGTLAAQKKLSDTVSGWRQLSIPLNTTIGTLSGINLKGAEHSVSYQRNIYYYNAAIQSGSTAIGWVAATTATDNYTRAYTIFGSNANNGLHTISTDLSITGTYVTGTRNISIYATIDPNGGASPDKTGWNLIPNPYASNLDVSPGSAFWRASGMPSGYKAIHIWNATGTSQYIGICSTGVAVNPYNNGQTTSTASVIAPFQSFWIKTAAPATLKLNDTMRTTSMASLGIYMKKQYAVARVNLLDKNDKWDQAVVYLHSSGTVGFNGETDAYKLFSMDAAVPSIYIGSVSNEPACVKAMPELADSFEIALSTINKAGGKLRFFLDNSEMGPEWDLFLKDSRTNTYTPMHTGDTLRLDLPDTTEGVLYLVMKKRSMVTGVVEEIITTSGLTVGGDGENIHISGTETGWTESNYTLYDLSGRQVQTGNVILDNQKGAIKMDSLPAGIYMLHLDATGSAYKVIKN